MTQSLAPRGVSWGERGRKAGVSLLSGLLAVPVLGAVAAGAAPAGPDASVLVRHRAGAERSVTLRGSRWRADEDRGRSLAETLNAAEVDEVLDLDHHDGITGKGVTVALIDSGV